MCLQVVYCVGLSRDANGIDGVYAEASDGFPYVECTPLGLYCLYKGPRPHSVVIEFNAVPATMAF